MDKMLYQIVIKENDINDYILGRISGILDWCGYTEGKIQSTDVLFTNGEWVLNCKMYYGTYIQIRKYITECYPDIKIEYFKIIDGQRVEA